MKPLPLVLAVSLAANAACLALYFTRDRSAASAATATTTAKAALTPGTRATAEAAAQNAALTEAWTQLQSGDLTTLAARLRAAGFSTAMIHAIVGAQVNAKFYERRKALIISLGDQPFWKNRQGFNADPKVAAELRALAKEQSALVKSLLGPEALYGPDDTILWQMRAVAGNLPVEKFSQLQRINSDYAELVAEIYQKSKGVILPEDREKLAFLEKEKAADIARTLTPQEYENVQLHRSPAANQVRSQLGSFEATESEFRAMYKLQTEFDSKYSLRDGPLSPDVMATRNEAEKQLKAAILASLPPDRAAEYKQATDPAYQQVNRLVTRLELPPTTTQQVVSVQQDIQARANTLRTDRTLTPEARDAQLTSLQEEATTKLTTALTPRGLEAYKQNGGAWLQSLQTQPTSGTVQPGISLRPGS